MICSALYQGSRHRFFYYGETYTIFVRRTWLRSYVVYAMRGRQTTVSGSQTKYKTVEHLNQDWKIDEEDLNSL